MGDILGKFAVILFGIFFIFYIPVTIIALKQDATKQTYIDDTVVSFVDNARASGKITEASYMEMVQKIYSVQAPCIVEMYHGAKYATPDAGTDEKFVVGNDYYTTKDILGVISPDAGEAADYKLKNGDYIKVTVTNEEPTLGELLINLMIPSANTSIFTSYGGYVGNNVE